MVKPKGHIRTRHYTRKDGTTYTRYIAMVSVGYSPDGKRDRREGPSRARAKDAQDDLQQMLEEAQRGIVSSDMRLDDFCAWWLEQVRPSVRHNTYTNYKNSLNRLCKGGLGITKLGKFTAVMAQNWLGDMYAQGYAPATVNKTLTTAAQALDDAVRQDMIAKNPLRLVKKPRHQHGHAKLISEGDVKRFLTYCQQQKDPRWYAAFYLMFAVGLRGGELRGLLWRDYEKDAGTLRIERQAVKSSDGLVLGELKTNASRRTLHLDADVIAVLEHYRTRAPHKSYMFPNARGGLMGETSLADFVNYARGHLDGLPKFTPHDARDFALSRLAIAGADAATLSAIAGHSSVMTTYQKYIKPLEDRKERYRLTLADL